MREPKDARHAPDDFFLPDLCAIQPLLLLIVFSQLVAVVLVLARSGLAGFDWADFGLVSLFAVWVTLPGAWLLCRLRPQLMRLSRGWGAAAAYVLVLLLTIGVSVAGQMFLRQRLDLYWGDAQRVSEHILIAAIVTGIMFRYLYLQQQLNRQQQAELKARLDALQARIQPHFLFNSMNIIASLIPTRPQQAEQAVEDLAELFRASLSRGGTEVTLGHEIELCRRYLALESLRLGERLRVEWAVGPGLESLPIPLLTLQPLIENAIVHGIQPRVDGGTVHIAIGHRDGCVEVQVSNPVADAVSGTGNRMALDNIRDRLLNLYGEQVSLGLERGEAEVVMRLRYPVVERRA